MNKNILALLVLILIILQPVFLVSCTQETVTENEIVLKSDNFSIYANEMSYLFYHEYESILNETAKLGDYAVNITPDPGISLKEQDCSLSNEKISWFEYIMDRAEQKGEDILVNCEAARALGLDIEGYAGSIALKYMENLENTAKDEGLSKKEYIENCYGKNVKEDDIMQLFRKEAYSDLYKYRVRQDSYPSDEEINNKYSEKKYSFESLTLINYAFDYRDIISDGSDEAAIAEAKEHVKKLSEELSSLHTEEDFTDFIKNHLVSELDIEEEILEDVMDQLYIKSFRYSDNPEIYTEFENSDPGATLVFENEDNVYVIYFLLSKNQRDEKIIYRNFKSIYFPASKYEDDKVVKKVFEELKESGFEDEAFDKAVIDYSGDYMLLTDGGTVEYSEIGDNDAELDKWLADASAGDSEIVKTEQGYYIVKLTEEFAEWKYSIVCSLINEKIYQITGENSTEYEVIYYPEAADSLDY